MGDFLTPTFGILTTSQVVNVSRVRKGLYLLGIGALLLVPSCSSGSGADPAAGDVFVDPGSSGEDKVTFYLAGDKTRSSVEHETHRAVRAAGLEIEESEARHNDDDELWRVRIHTSLDENTRFLEHRIDGQILAELDGGGSLFLDIPASAQLSSAGREVERNPMERTYEIPADESVTFRYSLARLALPLCVLLFVMAIVRLATGAYVARVRRNKRSRVDKLHSLQFAMAGASVVLPLVAFVVGGATGALSTPMILVRELWPSGPEAISQAVMVSTFVLIMVAFVLVVGLPAQTYYRELREIKQSRKESRRRQLRGLIFGLIPLGMLVAFNVLTSVVDQPAWSRIVLEIAFLVGIFTVGPLAIGKAFGYAEMDPQLRERLRSFVRSQGVKVRDVRAIKGNPDKHANAILAGLIPGFRYIFITDYLIDGLEEEELKAIVAHEVGHAKKRHLLIKFGAPFLALGVVIGAMALLAGLDVIHGPAVGLVVLAAFLLMIPATLVFQGAVGLKLEYAADDFAQRAVGLEPTISALEKLAELNMAKRKTGRVFNLLSQHPSIEERIKKLRSAQNDA